MRTAFLILILVSLPGFAQEAPPQDAPGRNLEWKEVAVLLEEEKGTVWAYLPLLIERPLAEALRRRVELRLPTVLLFPLEALEDPDSYSAYFFYAQMFRPNLKVGLLRLQGERKGKESILLLQRKGKQEVFLVDRELGVRRADQPERFFAWWRASWERREKVDPLAHAREAFMRGVREGLR